MASPPWIAPEPLPPAQTQPGCLSYLLFGIAAAWIAAVTLVMQYGAWFYSQIQLIDGVPVPGWFWVVIALVQALFTGAPALALAAFGGAPRLRAAARAWFWAVAFGLLLSLARLCPVTWTQPAAVVQIVLSLLATFFISKLSVEHRELRNDQSTKQFSILHSPFSILSFALGMLIILPWLRNGALGSPTDTLLNLLAALSLGLFAGALLDRLLLAPLLAHPARAWHDIGAGGVAAGVALLVLGAGFGFGGSQILLMIMLLSLGGAALAIGRWARVAGPGQAWLPIAGLVAVVVAGPLLLLDPDESFLGVGGAAHSRAAPWAGGGRICRCLADWCPGLFLRRPARFLWRATIHRHARAGRSGRRRTNIRSYRALAVCLHHADPARRSHSVAPARDARSARRRVS